MAGSYNKANLNTDNFIPHIDKAVLRAKHLDHLQEEYPTKLGSHIYKLANSSYKCNIDFFTISHCQVKYFYRA